MKSIVAVNCDIPTAERALNYFSGASLRDFDIAVFNPRFPPCERVYFDGGGSVFSIEATKDLANAKTHWLRELTNCLKAGKTVFVVLDEHQVDAGAIGSTTKNRQRTYSSMPIHNYGAIPGALEVSNTKGSKIVSVEPRYRGLLDAINDFAEYRVVISSNAPKPIYAAKDGSTIGAECRFKDWPGVMVLLPFFQFSGGEFVERASGGEEVWTDKALRASNALTSQLVDIDKVLRTSSKSAPPPHWMSEIAMPAAVGHIDQAISELDKRIEVLQQKRSEEVSRKADLMKYSRLLYENGKPLERAIEKALRLLGFSAEGLEAGALEIDHVITSPSGKRMIGETEGKDNSAIDITKFRQLESNIGEDFQRDEVTEPAKGVLFGNGFRLNNPADRAEQFTEKSVINAKRLGSSLVRTSDLYTAVAYVLDNPNDDAFKAACRAAIEDAPGGIVQFPKPPGSA